MKVFRPAFSCVKTLFRTNSGKIIHSTFELRAQISTTRSTSSHFCPNLPKWHHNEQRERNKSKISAKSLIEFIKKQNKNNNFTITFQSGLRSSIKQREKWAKFEIHHIFRIRHCLSASGVLIATAVTCCHASVLVTHYSPAQINITCKISAGNKNIHMLSFNSSNKRIAKFLD